MLFFKTGHAARVMRAPMGTAALRNLIRVQQRTILTAEHIPHPLIPCRELFDAYGNEIPSSSSLVLADGWRGHPASPTADGVVSFGIMPTLPATLAADASGSLGKMPTPPSPLPSRMSSWISAAVTRRH